MEEFVSGALRIAVSTPRDGLLRLEWRGKSNERHPGAALAPFFERLASLADDQALAIEMHFEKLEHFNSSTISSLIQLIQELRSKQLRLVLVFDARLNWQKLSFDALRIFEKPDGLLAIRASEV